jgi:hypothetical protein
VADAFSARTHGREFDKISVEILETERSEGPEGREASRRSVNLISSARLFSEIIFRQFFG